MKTILTKVSPAVLTALVSLTIASPVLADGYSPYGHIPEETGFADGLTLTIAAIAVYGMGLVFIVLSRLVKNQAVKLSQ